MMIQRVIILVLCHLLLFAVAVPMAPAQSERPVQAVREVRAVRESLALTYPEGETLSVKFQGTSRLPKSSGEAKIERKKGMTEVEIELDEMKPATLFGGDYNTYVLWAVSPEGLVTNMGEFVLEGNRSKLNVSTPLGTFGMFITAEPHFLVDAPSTFVVLENTQPTKRVAGNMISVSRIKYRGFEGLYNYDNESLARMSEAKGEVRADLEEAKTAIDLAVRAGAESHAAMELERARDSWKKAQMAAQVGSDKRDLMLLAHDAVRAAVEAQKRAQERSFQAALNAERRDHADEKARLAQSIQDAQSEAERARLQAEEKELKLRMEEEARRRAVQEADLAARRAADAQERAQQLAAAKSQSDQEAERARLEREAARETLRLALAAVAETRETARGLIVNVPDIFFDFNRSSLRPHGREILSKIAGILLVSKKYTLKLEGHTDSIGSDAYNQKLSEDRARSVRDYLAHQGLPPDLMISHGFGESQPVASNKSAEGRQRNRRVEIVIQDSPDRISSIR